MQNHHIALALIAALTPAAALAASPVATAAGTIDVSVRKIPGTTAIHGEMRGVMAAPFERVVQVLCDYDQFHLFSETTEIQATVDAATAARLKAQPPADNDAARPFARRGAVPSGCPGAEADVLSIQDFPFPAPDTWMLVRYRPRLDGDTLTIAYELQGGTCKRSNGTWTVRRVDAQQTMVEQVYDFDTGLSLPEFLIRLASKSQLPDLFRGIERQARQ